MSNDERQTEALDKLVKVVAFGSQITALHKVVDLIQNAQKTGSELVEWANKEIARLEKARDES